MAQEIKTVTSKPIVNNTDLAELDSYLSMLNDVGGWELKNSHFLGRVENGWVFGYVLVRDVPSKLPKAKAKE